MSLREHDFGYSQLQTTTLIQITITTYHLTKNNNMRLLYFLLARTIICAELDVDPRRDDDTSPMSTYKCMLRPTRMISALRHKSKFNFELKIKNKSKFNFEFFLNQIFMFPWCSAREDLSIDVSIITNVGLILTKLR